MAEVAPYLEKVYTYHGMGYNDYASFPEGGLLLLTWRRVRLCRGWSSANALTGVLDWLHWCVCTVPTSLLPYPSPLGLQQ